MRKFICRFRLGFQTLSLKKKMTVSYIAILLLPFILFISLLIGNTTQNEYKTNVSHAIAMLSQLSSNVESLIGNTVNISRVVVANAIVQRYFAEYDQINRAQRFSLKSQIGVFFDSIIEPQGDIDSIILYSPKGAVVASSRVDERYIPNYYLSDKRHAARMDESWGKSIYTGAHSVNYLRSEKAVQYISVLRPVIDQRTGAIVGTAEINVDEQTLSAYYRETFDARTSVLIYDRSGMIISCNNAQKIGASVALDPYYAWTLTHSEASERFSIDGVETLISSVHVPLTGWTVVSRTPIKNLDSVAHVQIKLFLLFSFLCLIIIVIVSTIFITAITRPITSLAASMRGAAQGDLSVQVDLPGDDEIAQLGRDFNRMIRKIDSLMQTVLQEQLHKKELQFRALQAQISPHFLYNTLESIRALLHLKMWSEAQEMVTWLEIFYKTSLSDGKNIVSLHTELENAKSYLQILKIRYSDKFDFELNAPEALWDFSVVKLSLQPIVENAVYHGIRQKSGKGLIRIACTQEKDILSIAVADDGPGISKTLSDSIFSQPATSGFGLYNVDQRIKLYFGNDYGVVIDSSVASGALVKLIFPVRYKMQEDSIDDSSPDC
ncbi:MAG: sensor histidine kinase [Clostridia bacterium]